MATRTAEKDNGARALNLISVAQWQHDDECIDFGMGYRSRVGSLAMNRGLLHCSVVHCPHATVEQQEFIRVSFACSRLCLSRISPCS